MGSRNSYPNELRITDPARLDDIVEIVRDYWFNLDDIVFDRSEGVVEIPFVRPCPDDSFESPPLGRRPTRAWLRCYLYLYGVRRLNIYDPEDVGRYDFHEICYEPVTHQIQIKTGIPLQLSAEVDKVEVCATITGQVIGYGH